MQSVNYALPLCGAGNLESVGVMAEELLVDSGGAADGGHRGELFGLAEHGGGIKLVI